MNGNNIFVDTNIILSILSGDKKLAESLYLKQFYLSFVNEIELLSYKNISRSELQQIKNILSECIIIDINREIKSRTIDFRIRYSLKLPDAIIAATASYLKFPFITSDNDFRKISEANIIIYNR